MAKQETNSYCDFYYEKGRTDYLKGLYEQPFPFPSSGVLDNFEKECNLYYTKGYQEERISFESFAA
jgi:hypothetical protein